MKIERIGAIRDRGSCVLADNDVLVPPHDQPLWSNGRRVTCFVQGQERKSEYDFKIELSYGELLRLIEAAVSDAVRCEPERAMAVAAVSTLSQLLAPEVSAASGRC